MDELDALKSIDLALGSLDSDAQARALLWIGAKYGKGALVGAAPPAPLQTVESPAQGAGLAAIKLDLSVNAIAQRLGAKSAGSVLRAAAASLTFVQGKENFAWKELLAEAARATNYWTKHHPANAAQAAKTLKSDNVLIELANGNLALSPTGKSELSTKLGSEK